LPESLKTASIDPITSDTMRKNGLTVGMEAAQYDLDGLVDAIVGFYSK
ncbi:MAG: hypothetical protein JO151_07715, partial [Verrucomicrobia bacterium]|nr:hypothetical protein [Verrucomicrobiota bacterium]